MTSSKKKEIKKRETALNEPDGGSLELHKDPELPEAYLERMKEILGDEYPAFLESYKRASEKGLRFNTSKVRPETVDKLVSEWGLEQIPWCEDGYYYPDDVRPGLSPYHAAGVFYMQEPSAMLPGSLAKLTGREIVLDLCAAPGGKSTQLAVNAGVLISNDPIIGRAKTLSSNIERMGLKNVIVTSAYPGSFCEIFSDCFDVIMVDAPCSGEGMFRKDSEAIRQWSPDIVEHCIVRQKEILDDAAPMLKDGGTLIYSTCTFEIGENEDQISAFLTRHEDFRLVSEHRIYPHRERGEGHFCAVLKKGQFSYEVHLLRYESLSFSSPSVPLHGCDNKYEARSESIKQNDNTALGKWALDDTPHEDKRLDGLPVESKIEELSGFLKRNGIHVLRAGVEKGRYIEGRVKKAVYEPSHAEALAKIYENDQGGKVNLLSDELCGKYLRGEALYLKLPENEDGYEADTDHGFVTVYYDRYPLGNGKLVNGVLKNQYPKGLRLLS